MFIKPMQSLLKQLKCIWWSAGSHVYLCIEHKTLNDFPIKKRGGEKEREKEKKRVNEIALSFSSLMLFIQLNSVASQSMCNVMCNKNKYVITAPMCNVLDRTFSNRLECRFLWSSSRPFIDFVMDMQSTLLSLTNRLIDCEIYSSLSIRRCGAW